MPRLHKVILLQNLMQFVQGVYLIKIIGVNLQTLFAITSLLEIHRAESGKIRVGAFGILGEYLFEKQRKWAQGRDVPEKSDAKPNPTIPSIFESVRAVLLIQRYFRRFVQRRRERVEAVKSLAKTESSDARDKLRKRRLERRAEKREEIN